MYREVVFIVGARKWTDDEIALLRECSNKIMSSFETAELLGRNAGSVRVKAKKLGLSFRSIYAENARKWTEDELKEIASKVAIRPIKSVAPEYGLTTGGLADVMFRYKIPGRGLHRKHTPEEIEATVGHLRGVAKVPWDEPRKCKFCLRVKQPEEFPKKDQAAHNLCKKCYHKTARYNNYGLNVHTFILLLEEQNHICPICEKFLDPEDATHLHVDHDHKCCPRNKKPTCGKCVRAILHPRCNILLGAYESILLDGYLPNIVSYLEDYKLVADTISE